MSRRGNIRRSGGGGGGGSGGGSSLNPLAQAYYNILGNNLIFLLHSQLGVGVIAAEADTWTDQIGGKTLTAFSAVRRPAYGADGALFGGKSVIKTAVASSRCMKLSGVSASFIPNNSRPWCFLRSRARVTVVQGRSVNVGGNAGNESLMISDWNGTTMQLFSNGVGFTVGPASDLLIHSRNYGMDGANQVYTVDGSTATTAYAGGINGSPNVSEFAVGCAAWSPAGLDGNAEDSIALWAICASQPSAPQIAAVMALMAAEFPP